MDAVLLLELVLELTCPDRLHERRLAQVKLGRHAQHPLLIPSAVRHDHGCGVARVRGGCEAVRLDELDL